MKKLIVILFFVVFACSISINANAESFEFDVNDSTDLFSQMYEDYGVDGLVDNSPEEVKDFVKNFGITPADPFSFKNLFSENGFDYIKNYLSDSLFYPIKYLSIMLISILVCAVCSSFSDNSLQVNHSMNLLCVTVVASVMIIPVTTLINDVVSIVNTVSVFMGVFIPIFAGILIACLKSGTAVAYSSIMFFTCETISYCCKAFVLPFANCFTALSVAGGISGNSRLNGIIKILKKLAFIIITASMAVFIAVLSIQSVVNSTADNVATKTAKFFISSFVPIVGSSISEALGSLKGCVSLLKSSAGIYAVIAIIIMFIPLIIKIISFKIMLTFCADFSELFFVEAIKSIAEALNSALSIILSVAICVCVMFIFSITIISVAGGSL